MDQEGGPIYSGDRSIRMSFMLQEFSLGAFSTVSSQALEAGLGLPLALWATLEQQTSTSCHRHGRRE